MTDVKVLYPEIDLVSRWDPDGPRTVDKLRVFIRVTGRPDVARGTGNVEVARGALPAKRLPSWK